MQALKYDLRRTFLPTWDARDSSSTRFSTDLFKPSGDDEPKLRFLELLSSNCFLSAIFSRNCYKAFDEVMAMVVASIFYKNVARDTNVSCMVFFEWWLLTYNWISSKRRSNNARNTKCFKMRVYTCFHYHKELHSFLNELVNIMMSSWKMV